MIFILDNTDCNIMKTYKVFTHARDLSYFKYHHCEFENSQFFVNDMQNIDLTASKFNDCAFSSTSLKGATLSHAVFTRTNFYRVDFTNTKLEGTIFDHCAFRECILPVDFYNRAVFLDWNNFSRNTSFCDAECEGQENLDIVVGGLLPYFLSQ